MSVAYGEEKGDAAQKGNNELRPFLFVDAFESQIVAVIKENTLLTHPTINDMVNHPPGALRAVRGILIDYQKHPNSQELDLSQSCSARDLLAGN